MKSFHTVFIALVFFCLTAQPSLGQSSGAIPEASPEQAGMSAERLSNLDTMLENAIKNDQVPGAVALVARNGKVVYHKAFGMADHETGREFNKHDIFRIASQTKAITSTAVMMLWEEGRFQLDDPISDYIPEFQNPTLLESYDPSDTSYTTSPAGNEITIRHLLTHTSGIGYGMIDSDNRFREIYQKAGITDLFTTEPVLIGDSVEKLAALPLHHPPGEQFTYSEGLDVLGYFIEVVSGISFDQFLKERIFEPLGMNDTWFYLPDEKSDRLAPVQTRVDGNWINYPVTFYDPEYPVQGAKTFFSGGAGVSSTAMDYAIFLQMYLNGGQYNGTRILSRTTVQTIMANHAGDLYGGDNKHYGLAFGVVTQDGRDSGGIGGLGTFDWGGYFNTQYFADPENNIIGVLMKQTQTSEEGTGDTTAWKFRQIIGASVDD